MGSRERGNVVPSRLNKNMDLQLYSGRIKKQVKQ